METNVWHTTLEIGDRKFLLYYKMSFEAFNNLVLQLTPFFAIKLFKPHCAIIKY